MNKRRKRNKKGIVALALSFCMLFGTMLTVQAKDYSYRDIVAPNGVTGGDVELPTLQTGDRILADPNDDIVLNYLKATLNTETGFYENEEKITSVTVKAGSGSVEILEGKWKVVGVAGYDIDMYLISGEDSGSEEGSRKSSHTSSYERGLKYAAQQKVVKSYSTLTNPGIDGNGHPLIYSTFVKEMPNQIAAAPENGTVTFGNPTYNTLPGTVMEALQERPDVTLIFEFNYEGSARKITIPAGKADTNGYEYYGPALLINLYGE